MFRRSAPFAAALSSGVPHSSDSDVVVIGSGIVGCCTAFELAKLGFKVTVLDKTVQGGPGSGTTSYSSGVIRTFYSNPSVIKLAWEAFHLWSKFDTEYIEPHLGKSSSSQESRRPPLPEFRTMPSVITETPNSAGFIKEQIAHAKVNGIPFKQLDLQQTKELLGPMGFEDWSHYTPRLMEDPQFGVKESPQGVTGSVVFPNSGYFSDPRLVCQNVAHAASCLGVRFEHGVNVAGITKTHGRIDGVDASTANRTTLRFDAPVVVNAAGPYSCFVNDLAFKQNGDRGGQAGVDWPKDDSTVPTRPKRAEVAVVDAPPGIDYAKDALIVADLDGCVYMRPEVGNRLLVGSIDPECDAPVFYTESPDQVDSMDATLGSEWQHILYRAALRMPKIEIPTSSRRSQGITSLYDWTPDATAIVDGSSIPGYFMGIGTCGNCFKSAPLIGQMLAQRIRSAEAGSPHGEGVDRKHVLPLVRTNNGVLDCSVFSRKRRLDGTQSVGVMG